MEDMHVGELRDVERYEGSIALVNMYELDDDGERTGDLLTVACDANVIRGGPMYRGTRLAFQGWAVQGRKAPATYPEPHIADKIEPGAVLYSSWGYDQTNIDFYLVTRTTKSSAWIVPMTNVITDDAGFMCEHVVAGTPDPFAKPEIHRIKRYDYGNGDHEALHLTSYSSASLWEGGKLYASHYA